MGVTLVAVWVLASVPVSAASELEWPARLFKLASSDSFAGAIYDVVETPDGHLFVASSGQDGRQGGSVSELDSDGRLTPVVEFPPAGGLGGVGLLTAPGGALIAADGWGSRLVRIRAAGEPYVIAGTGMPGFGGDRGPAVQAALDFGAQGFVGLARSRDGSVLFSDAWNNRVRRIRPDGTIETIAGVGPSYRSQVPPRCLDLAGDGGPATLATLCMPTDVLAREDGSILVSDTEHWRIRRIAPDGTISSLGGELPRAPTGLATLPSGDILLGHFSGVSRLSASGQRFRPFLTFETFAGGQDSIMVDFGGRGIGGARPVSGLRVTREGGIAFATQDLYYLAPRRTRWTLVGIRDARAGSRHLLLEIEATHASRAVVTVARDGRRIARASRAIRAGRRRLSIGGRFASGTYTVDVALTRQDGSAASDRILLYLGDSLHAADARRFARQDLDGDTSVGACTRMTLRRVDCWYRPTGMNDACSWTTVFQLRRTGQVWARSYRCRNAARPVRRRGAWTGPWTRVHLRS